MNPLIYVIDDDEKIREIISRYLLREGYRVHAFDNGTDALERLSLEPPDLVVLDVMMPGQDGYDVCKRIRATSDLPIIFVSARNQELDRILELELGGDDYLSKPFSPRELVARIKSVLRRVRTPHESLDLMRIGDLSIYPEARRVQSKGADIELTTKEYDFLTFLAENLNRVFTREQLMSSVWGYDFPGGERSVDDLVKRLRKKLKAADSNLAIQTVWGYGYKLEVEA